MTRGLFAIFTALLALQRLFELGLSQKHERALVARGARQYGASQFTLMKLLHVSWFISMLIEVFHFRRPFIPRLAKLAFAVFTAGQVLRYSAIRTLGERWTTRVFVLPGSMVKKGIYRYIRHPNYLGVILEIFAVPLLHTAYLTTLVFSLLNALLLRSRIRLEEKALSESGNYQLLFDKKPRFIPKLGWSK